MNRSLTPRSALRLLPEALPVKPSATATPHEQLVEYLNREIDRALLGSSLTTDAPPGAYALGSVHDEFRRSKLPGQRAVTPALAGAGAVPEASANPPRHSRTQILPLDLPRPLADIPTEANT